MHPTTIAALSAVAGLALSAHGQATGPTVFLANNGNLEGSVSSIAINPDGSGTLIEKVVIESRLSGGPNVPGTNAFAIDISPNGRYLANSHATALDPEQITLWRVAADGTIAIIGTGISDNAPLDLLWINNTLLAILRTDFGGSNAVILYRFDPDNATITELDRATTGGFTSAMDIHPSRRFIYAGDSTNNTISVVEVNPAGSLSVIQVVPVGFFPLGPTVSHDGTKLYAAGGISGGSDIISGYDILPDGTLQPMDASPFFSPGDSPKGMAFSPDDSILYVDHGRDATVYAFNVDQGSGDLTFTGNFFDVGFQGSHGQTTTMGDLVLFTDDWTIFDDTSGLYSFDILPNGSFANQNGPVVDGDGTGPEHLVAWSPPCPADLTTSADPNALTFGVPDGIADANDFFYYLDRFAAGDLDDADLTGSTDPNNPAFGVPDGTLDANDFFFYLGLFAQGCG